MPDITATDVLHRNRKLLNENYTALKCQWLHRFHLFFIHVSAIIYVYFISLHFWWRCILYWWQYESLPRAHRSDNKAFVVSVIYESSWLFAILKWRNFLKTNLLDHEKCWILFECFAYMLYLKSVLYCSFGTTIFQIPSLISARMTVFRSCCFFSYQNWKRILNLSVVSVTFIWKIQNLN